MAREDIKKDNRDNLYLVNKELSLLSLLSLKNAGLYSSISSQNMLGLAFHEGAEEP